VIPLRSSQLSEYKRTGCSVPVGGGLSAPVFRQWEFPDKELVCLTFFGGKTAVEEQIEELPVRREKPEGGQLAVGGVEAGEGLGAGAELGFAELI
jgi:hypothetical protein